MVQAMDKLTVNKLHIDTGRVTMLEKTANEWRLKAENVHIHSLPLFILINHGCLGLATLRPLSLCPGQPMDSLNFHGLGTWGK